MFQGLLAVVLAGTGLLAANGAGAWPGDPDGTFSSCGVKAIDALAGVPSAVRAMALTADGKVLGAGYAGDRGLVMRLTGGSTDATFGTGGKAMPVYSGTARFFAVAGTPSGGAIAVGRRTTSGAADTAIVRYRANGTPDPTFHGDGRLNLDVGGTDDARAVAVFADNSVVVAGNAAAGGFVERLTANGTPDASFDGDGRRAALPMDVRAMATRADGSIYVGGSTNANPADWRIIRLAADGSIDTGFGGANGLTVDIGGHDAVTALAMTPDGKLIATGFGKGASGHGQTVVRRYNADGTRDMAFTSYRDAFGVNDVPAGLTRREDGSVVVAVNSKVGPDNDIVLVRLGDDGVLDDSFGVGGVSVSDAGRRSTIAGIVVPTDGRPFALGSVRRGQDLARGVAILPGSSGVVVDAYGGLHGFTFADGPGTPPKFTGGPYWLGWDIVRGVAVVPEGTGGFVLDGLGGLHPFSIGGAAAPKIPTGVTSFGSLDLARGVALMPDRGGYVVDATGGIHPFGGAPAATPGGPSWPGQDVARGIALAPDGDGGWILDKFGGLHPFGIAGDDPPVATVGGPYWSGFAIARGAGALP
ncbi:MAG: hypothetical protein ABJC79_05660 [Acidimicrobiia bacterium]